jgi:3-methyl-2-oxobutanoate hydroxymethyltransferase
MRTTLDTLAAMKRSGEKIVMLTAYDFPSALLAERAGVPVLLIGDSLGMVMHGHDTTLPVSLDMMVLHASAVARGAKEALVVADMPFLAYTTPDEAVAAARRLMQEAGVQAVKLEGGAQIEAQVRRLTAFGVPVMGHLGFTPQSQHQIGLKVQAKEAEAARRLMEEALLLQDAGCFSLVLELVPAPLAQAVSERLTIPTIGIGAGAGCDGQVQVWHDILGLYEGKPKRHAKPYANLGPLIEEALKTYVAEVKAGAFPTAANSAKMDEAVLTEALYGR